MSEVQIFHATLDGARELRETRFRDEKEMQFLFERHLHDLTGIDFLDTEHFTGRRHRRFADTLGLDGQQRPVVIEYKHGQGGAAISQGLDYLYWLEDHKGDFRELVRDNLGSERSRNIDFKNAWLLCVAGQFKREDVISAKTNTRQIDLLRVRRHGESTVLLEWLLGGKNEPGPESVLPGPGNGPGFSKFRYWRQTVANAELHRLFNGFVEYLKSLGEEVWVGTVAEGRYFTAKTERGAFFNICKFAPQPQKNRMRVVTPGRDGETFYITSKDDLKDNMEKLQRAYVAAIERTKA